MKALLQIKARFDLQPLVARLEVGGLVRRREPSMRDGVCYAVLVTPLVIEKPSRIMESVLSAVESLEDEFRLAWDQCFFRQIMLGYVWRSDHLVATHAVSNENLRRLAALGLTLRITIHPEPSQPPIDNPDTTTYP